MANHPMKLPIFSRGSIDQLEKALTDGIFKDLDRIIYHYVSEGDNAGSLILVYADKSFHYITDAALATEVAELAERVQANSEDIEQIS